ncbi:MAG: proteasome subunit beta [Acidimicrobiia bacterium]
MNTDRLPDGLPADPVTPASSFVALLRTSQLEPRWEIPQGDTTQLGTLEGTTVLAVRYEDGVAMVGDRQATEGHLVAHRRVQKVFPADNFSAVAISGTAGVALELIRLFQTELEHYEKLEGARLSLDGKANHLAAMVRRQLPMAFQGLGVVPLFCGYDEREAVGRLYSFDVVGGRYEEQDFAAAGSGGREAKSHLRSAFRPGLSVEDGLRLALEALVVAAEEDTSTGGPDLRREIFPNVATVSGDGYREISEERVAELARSVLGETA